MSDTELAPLVKKAIAIRVKRMVGYEVLGLGDTLSMLTGPDLLPLLEELILAVKLDNKVLNK